MDMNTHRGEIVRVAKRMVWFKPPEEAMNDPLFFPAHVMTYGTVEDIAIAKAHFTTEDFRRALENPPPGLVDPRSWSCWNLMLGRWPAPPMPKRVLT